MVRIHIFSSLLQFFAVAFVERNAMLIVRLRSIQRDFLISFSTTFLHSSFLVSRNSLRLFAESVARASVVKTH